MDTRNPTKDYGGSYTPPMTTGPEGEVPRRFIMKEKVSEMMKYAMPLLDNFPRRNRKLADTLRDSVLEMYRLTTELEKAYYKKTTLQKLDVELAVVKEFVVLASDKDYCGHQFAPPLTMHQREVWSRHNDEIGRIIGGYIKAVRAKENA